MPVSYTHLDVYKRQPQHGDPAADARNSGGSADADAVDGAGSVVPNAYGDPVVRIVRTERLGGDVKMCIRDSAVRLALKTACLNR